MTTLDMTWLWGGSGRLIGLDIARGIAVLGMFVAHLYSPKSTGTFGWNEIFDGRSSILFAVLAGISVSIISGRPIPHEGLAAAQGRMRILTRAVAVFGLGAFLTWLGTSIAVILEYYAVLFVMCLPFVRWSARKLLILASISAVVMPTIRLVLMTYVFADDVEPSIIDLLVTGYYPALVWITYFLLGMGLGRLRLEQPRLQLRLIVGGTILATLAYGLAAIVPTEGQAFASALLSSEPHSDGIVDVIGGSGVATAVIGLCQWGGNKLRWVLFPVASVGSMALTCYTAHVLWLAMTATSSSSNLGPLLGLVGAALLACSIWRVLLGSGPLERVLSWLSHLTAGSLSIRKP